MPPRTTASKKPPSWGKSAAKKQLIKDIVDRTVTAEMDAATVYNSRPEFQKYPLKNFKTNLRNLRKSVAEGRLPKPPPWGGSVAKELLRSDIISGCVVPTMDAQYVYKMRPEFQLYKFGNFSSNLKNLRELITKNYKRMQDDVGYYGRDRGTLLAIRANDPPPEDPELSWHRSEAAKLLKKDIDDRIHTMMKPSEMYTRFPAYQDFPPDVFRKHVHQEVTDRARMKQRFEKKKLRQLGPPTRLVLPAADDEDNNGD